MLGGWPRIIPHETRYHRRHILNKAKDQPGTLGELISVCAQRMDAADLFYGHGTDNAFDEAISLAFDGLKLDRNEATAEQRLDADQISSVLQLTEQRITSRLPAAYLTGTAWFCGLPFHVDQNVLVPRSPIAELIEAGYAPWADPEKLGTVLDLCTGGGCIAIASALALPGARVTGSDISTPALDIAQGNAVEHNVADRVEFVRSDVYEGLVGRRYDIIVSNPPYVSSEEMASLPEEYLHEPGIGLAAGVDGLDIVDRIIAGASSMLSPDGLLIVEVGNSRATVEEHYSRLPLTWLEFERGGEGVFLISGKQLADAYVR